KRDWSSDVCSSDLNFINCAGASVAPIALLMPISHTKRIRFFQKWLKSDCKRSKNLLNSDQDSKLLCATYRSAGQETYWEQNSMDLSIPSGSICIHKCSKMR